MKFGVIVFPGSNCDDDMIHVLGSVYNQTVEKIWHKENELQDYGPDDCIILPGGFSFGDYLRTGAIAAHSNIIPAVKKFAENGGNVIGICNGFQILCELQLLPGALLRNKNQKFISKTAPIKVKSNNSRFTQACEVGQVLNMPVAHAEGRYYADEETLQELADNDQVLFEYCSEEGVVHDNYNFNGSMNNIAGICNKERNIFGMMPHPERASEDILGGADGKALFDSFIYQ